MPTGYTHPIADGECTTLEQFALACARAFGATITMRDDPSDTPIPEAFIREPGYHEEKLAKSRLRLEELGAMTTLQAGIAAKADYEESMASHVEYKAKLALQNQRMQAMLDQVNSWKPPEMLAGLHEFMVSQLKMSFSDYEPEEPVLQDAHVWLRNEFEQARRDIKYCEDEIAKDIERYAERNLWIKTLRESVRDPGFPRRAIDIGD